MAPLLIGQMIFDLLANIFKSCRVDVFVTRYFSELPILLLFFFFLLFPCETRIIITMSDFQNTRARYAEATPRRKF